MTELSGPRKLAAAAEGNIAELTAKLATVADRREAKRLRKVLKVNRDLLRWCKTRAGY